uniref:Uncharacterized protein n=1 Tax=Anguilla anguilla TaxID=7936 RepID=A0A0E9SY16_ANGAN
MWYYTEMKAQSRKNAVSSACLLFYHQSRAQE